MRKASDLGRIEQAGLRRIALSSVIAFVLQLLWVPAHLTFERHLHGVPAPRAACSPVGAGTVHAHHHAHGHDQGHSHFPVNGGDRPEPDGHEPHPASDHDAQFLALRSPTGTLVLAPPPAPRRTCDPRALSLGRTAPGRSPAPRARPPDPRTSRAPPGA